MQFLMFDTVIRRQRRLAFYNVLMTSLMVGGILAAVAAFF